MAETNPVAKIAGKGRTASLRDHINAKCAECMGCTPEAISRGFRGDITACTAKLCPLWPVRPYQKLTSPNTQGANGLKLKNAA